MCASQGWLLGRDFAFGVGPSINKTTNITERVSIEFYSEWFNALNHMNYGGDGIAYDLQNPEGFGALGQFNALQGDYTRVIQLGLRLSF